MRLTRALVVALVGLTAIVPTASGYAPSRVPLPPRYEITIGQCPGYEAVAGCAFRESAHVYVADERDRFTRYHELGHLYDAQVLTVRDRSWFMAAFHFTGMWEGETALDEKGYAVEPVEVFADEYARCALGQRTDTPEWAPFGSPKSLKRRGARMYQRIVLSWHRATAKSAAP